MQFFEDLLKNVRKYLKSVNIPMYFYIDQTICEKYFGQASLLSSQINKMCNSKQHYSCLDYTTEKLIKGIKRINSHYINCLCNINLDFGQLNNIPYDCFGIILEFLEKKIPKKNTQTKRILVSWNKSSLFQKKKEKKSLYFLCMFCTFF